MLEAVELSEKALQQKNLIVRNLQEVLGDEKLTKQLSTGKNIHVYWGTATTGRPHVGYFVPMQKIADLLHAGLKVTILFADLHAFLDNLKSTFTLLENRVLYYEHVIKALLTALDVPIDKLYFIKGSTYQLSDEYTRSLLKLCGHVSQRDALKAGAEVVKQVESPLLSGLLYPLLQALDEQFLKVDGQLGGVDQRKIFILAEEQLPKLKFTKRFHLMNPMVPGLTGSKMSSSEENTKIDLLDSAEVVARKIQSAVCSPLPEQNQENGILSFFKFVVLPILENRIKTGATNDDDNAITLQMNGKNYVNYELIEADFNNGFLKEETLKTFLIQFLNGILEKVRAKCSGDELKRILENAYPSNIPGDSTFESEFDNVLEQLELEDSQRFENILENLECIHPSQLKCALREKRRIRVLYRCSAKGRVNLAHLGALIQLKRLQGQCDCECLILISDLGAYLDNAKCPWAALEGRSRYYEVLLRELARVIDLKNVKIVHSVEFEYKEEYVLNMYKVISKVTRDETALVAGSTLSCNLSPVYFLLDVCYVNGGADILLIGNNERRFFEFCQRFEVVQILQLPNRLPSALVLPEIIGMDGLRMSSTQPDFYLEPFDTAKQTRQKIAKSFCEPGNLKGNVALSLAQQIVFPLLDVLQENSTVLTIERTEENGGNLEINNYKELEDAFVSEILHPADLKATIVNKINALFNEVRNSIVESDLQKLLKEALPPTPKGAKQKK